MRPRRERKDNEEGRASAAGGDGLAVSNSGGAFRSLAAQVSVFHTFSPLEVISRHFGQKIRVLHPKIPFGSYSEV